MNDSALFRRLRRKLTLEDLECLAGLRRTDLDPQYDRAIRCVVKRLPAVQRQILRNKERFVRRYAELTQLPKGRVATLLTNCDASMLVTLTRKVLEQSYAERLRNPKKSLQLAHVALQSAVEFRSRIDLNPETALDLEAEAWMHLANAWRINSRIRSAERALSNSKQLLGLGTGDRALKADYCSFAASLRFRQGRPEDALALLNQEINLRRLIGDRARLGAALIDRGWITGWTGSLSEACDYLYQGVALVDEPERMILALHALVELLAREGDGLMAWKVIIVIEVANSLLGDGSSTSLQWHKGLTYLALRRFGEAEEQLRTAWEALVHEGASFKAALAGLDLATALAALGHVREVSELAEQAYTIFKSEGLENRALAAFQVFYQSARAGTLTTDLAVRVTTFLARHRYHRRLGFQDPIDLPS